MANQDWAFGMQPIRGPHGEAPKTTRLPLRQGIQSTAYSTPIYKGQIVLWGASGWVKANASGTPHNDEIVGVSAAYYPGSSSTATDLPVWGPEHDFVVQSDGGTTSTNKASYLMKNFDVTGAASGNTDTGYSGMELDFSSGELTTATHTLQVHGFDLHPGDSVAAPNVNCIVKFLPGIGIGNQATF